jgi:hypothetical protein
MFLRKYKDKQLFCGHNTLIEGVFVTQLVREESQCDEMCGIRQIAILRAIWYLNSDFAFHSLPFIRHQGTYTTSVFPGNSIYKRAFSVAYMLL